MKACFLHTHINNRRGSRLNITVVEHHLLSIRPILAISRQTHITCKACGSIFNSSCSAVVSASLSTGSELKCLFRQPNQEPIPTLQRPPTSTAENGGCSFQAFSTSMQHTLCNINYECVYKCRVAPPRELNHLQGQIATG